MNSDRKRIHEIIDKPITNDVKLRIAIDVSGELSIGLLHLYVCCHSEDKRGYFGQDDVEISISKVKLLLEPLQTCLNRQ